MLVNERPEASRNPQFDCEASLREARARKPLKSLMVDYGHDPKNGKWKTMDCPFCHHKGCAGVVEQGGTDFFKCFHTDCPTGGKGLDEVGYIAQESNLNRKEAFTAYLKMTDVWKDRTKLRSPEAEPGAASNRDRLFDKTEKTSDAAGGSPDPVSGFTPEELERAVESGDGATAGQGGQGAENDDGRPPWSEGDSGEPKPSTEPEMGKSEVPKATEPSDGAPAPEEKKAPTSGEPDNVVPLPDFKKVNDELRDVAMGLEALREFYGELKLSTADEESLFRKRGLTSAASAALGYRSNNRSNGAILGDLLKRYSEGALVTSGLFFRDKKSGKLRFSAIYTGMGRVGDEEWVDEEGKKHERVKREYTQPILIPYLNSHGELVRIRPHKDFPAGQTPMLYIPRSVVALRERKQERFERVVLTEGEFKAGALWQVLGEGREDGGEPYGVAALPGINMAKNEDVRYELDEWLSQIGAREVFIAYDRQDKSSELLPSGKPNPAYNPDPKKRYDAEIWSRFLAIDLKRKLHVYARVTTFPESWMDENLKADWDGALSKMVRNGKVGSSRKHSTEEDEDLAYG